MFSVTRTHARRLVRAVRGQGVERHRAPSSHSLADGDSQPVRRPRYERGPRERSPASPPAITRPPDPDGVYGFIALPIPPSGSGRYPQAGSLQSHEPDLRTERPGWLAHGSTAPNSAHLLQVRAVRARRVELGIRAKAMRDPSRTTPAGWSSGLFPASRTRRLRRCRAPSPLVLP